MKYFGLLLFGILLVSCKKETPKGNVGDHRIDTIVAHSMESSLELKKLTTEFIASKIAVAKKLESAKPKVANALYIAYIKENGNAILAIEEHERDFLNNYETYFFSHERKPVPDSISRKLEMLKKAGLEIWDIGEGMVEIRTVPRFYADLFGDRVTEDFRKFIEINADEDKLLFNNDAAINVPLEEVGRRVINWENFIAKYPESGLIAEARKMYLYYQMAYLFGDANTPVMEYPSGKIWPENLADFQKFVAKHPESPTAGLINLMLNNTGDYESISKTIFEQQQNMGFDTSLYEDSE